MGRGVLNKTITKQSVTISFTPDDVCIVDQGDFYTLNYLIDRSEKGKFDDVGTDICDLSLDEARAMQENGFGIVGI